LEEVEKVKWTVEFEKDEVEAIAKAVSVAFVDKEKRAVVVAEIFARLATRGKFDG
jgi:hypothetical protein